MLAPVGLLTDTHIDRQIQLLNYTASGMIMLFFRGASCEILVPFSSTDKGKWPASEANLGLYLEVYLAVKDRMLSFYEASEKKGYDCHSSRQYFF